MLISRSSPTHMACAATVRRQIELSLEARFPAALSPVARTVREVASTGVEAADRILEGGLPVGAISEIVGPACSGRTSLAMSFVAQRTGVGCACAWVDVHDSLDPEGAKKCLGIADCRRKCAGSNGDSPGPAFWIPDD